MIPIVGGMLRWSRTASLLLSIVVLLAVVLGGCREPAERGAPVVSRATQALAFGQNAVAYYPFDGAGTDVAGGLDLGLVNAPGFEAGLFGQALALPADATKYAQRPADDAAFDFAGDFTVQVWVRFASTAGQQTLVEKFLGPAGPGWTLEKLADDTLHFYALPTAIMTSPAIGFAPNAWNQIVLRRTGDTFEILRNGAVVVSAQGAGALPDSAQPLLVGRREGLQLNPVNGRLDEVAVFARSLSDAEIANLWNGGSGRRVATDVTVAPAAANVAPRGAQAFVASGGIGTSTSFTYALTTNGSGGSVNPVTGAYTAGPTPNVVDVVTATDAAGNTGTANVNVGAGVSITPGAPAAVAPQGAIAFAAAGGSGAGYTWSLATNASGATLSAGGAYKAGPTPNVVDVVHVTDSLGNSADVSIPVGAGVAISPPSASVAPRESRTFLANGGSNAGFTWSFVTNASGGSLVGNVYRAGATGSVVDRIQVTDSLNNKATADITVGPQLAVTPASASAPPNGSVGFGTSGGSGIVSSWAVVTNNSGATINAAGVYRAGATGNVTDIVRATDSFGNTAQATITVTGPVAITPNGATTAPRGVVSFGASGGSGAGYTWSIRTNSSGASISAAGVYTAGVTGAKTDVVRVTDSLGNVRDVNVTVTAGVTIAPANPSAPPLGSVQLTATGGSNNGFTWAVTSNNSGSSVSAAGLFTAGATGNVADTVQVTDAFGNTASVSVSVGGGLSINPAAPSTPPRGNVALTVTGGSGVGFVWAFVTNASGGTVASNTGAYKAGPTGNVTDVVKVTDSLGNTRSVSITVTAGAAITPTTANVAPLGTAAFAASGGSGAGYTYSFATNGSGGTVSASGAYKAGTTGNVSDVVLVTDSLGNTASATVTVTVAVSITPANTSVAPRGAATFAASGGAGGYTFSLQTSASGGNVSATGGAYTAGSKGSVVDVVRVTDANGATASATVNVGAEIAIAPSPAHSPPLGTIPFTATGGSGFGYVWELATTASGGTMNAATGEYTAGETANTVDTVRVSDSLGNVAILGVSVGNGIGITPAAGAAPPRGGIAFSATGGSGSGYTWALHTNASGGSVDAKTGFYTAGDKGNVVDIVEVTDAVGGKLRANVEVGGGVTISPDVATVDATGTIAFSVAGGSGAGYAWSIDPNVSGSAIGPDGKYVAGLKGGVDVVVAKDSLGNTAKANVTVVDKTAPGGTSTNPGGFGAAPPANPDDACGCRIVGGRSRDHLALGGVLVALVLAARRRRRA